MMAKAGIALAVLVSGLALTTTAAADQTITAVGTAQEKVTPKDRTDNKSIADAVEEAHKASIPAAIQEARDEATQLAQQTGLTLGAVQSVDENISRWPLRLRLRRAGALRSRPILRNDHPRPRPPGQERPPAHDAHAKPPLLRAAVRGHVGGGDVRGELGGLPARRAGEERPLHPPLPRQARPTHPTVYPRRRSRGQRDQPRVRRRRLHRKSLRVRHHGVARRVREQQRLADPARPGGGAPARAGSRRARGRRGSGRPPGRRGSRTGRSARRARSRTRARRRSAASISARCPPAESPDAQIGDVRVRAPDAVVGGEGVRAARRGPAGSRCCRRASRRAA